MLHLPHRSHTEDASILEGALRLSNSAFKCFSVAVQTFFPRLSIDIQKGISALLLKTRQPFFLTALNPQASGRECDTVGMWISTCVSQVSCRRNSCPSKIQQSWNAHPESGSRTLLGSVLDPAFKACKSSSLFY